MKRFTLVLFAPLALGWPGFGCQQDDEIVVDRDAFEARAELEPDLPIVDNGDGTWSYALPEGFDPATRVQGKLVTWRYEGQARHSWEPTFGAERSFTVPEPGAGRSHRERLEDLRRVDRQGRIWSVEAIDEDAWLAAMQPDDESDWVAPSLDEPIAEDDDLAPGTVVRWKPMSWDHRDCVAGSGGVFSPNEGHFWDGDGRDAKSSSWASRTDRQKSAVFIQSNGTQICSGVMVRSDQVLTAAHCVSDDNNNRVSTASITVCRAAGDCRNVSDIDFPNSYTGGSGSGGGTDFADDWAVLELSSTWPTTETMDLSHASDDKLDDLTKVRNLAFPGYFPYCTLTGATLINNIEVEPIAAIKNRKLRFKIDGTPGHSGSPLYYCSAGNDNECLSGQRGKVIGVFSGYNSVNDRFVGPKVPDAKPEMVVFIED